MPFAIGKTTTDIATVRHWESVWKQTDSVHGFSRINYYDFRLSKLFEPLSPPGSKVIEIGCGGSRWISYFDIARQCETWGIDYSDEGLRITQQNNLNRPNVHLVAGDFFDESLLPVGYFDLVFSLGFIEHFTESAVVTRHMMNILRPGGRVMTLIPNFVSAYGKIQKWVNPETFDKHVVMDCAKLDIAHLAAGMKPVAPAFYFGCFGPGVVDYGHWQRIALPPIKLAQHFTCWSLHALRFDRESRRTSPYIVGIYEKPN